MKVNFLYDKKNQLTQTHYRATIFEFKNIPHKEI